MVLRLLSHYCTILSAMRQFLFGRSAAFQYLERITAVAGASDLPVLLEGESGSGKEALARHIAWKREGDAELFQYYGGRPPAFGKRGKSWLQEICSPPKRALFLKHVNLLSVPQQSELLRAVQSERNSLRAMKLLASSSEALEGQVARGAFLADLYFHLSSFRIALPPLRSVREDIPAFFLQALAEKGREIAEPLAPLVQQALQDYSWPGNFRELESLAQMHAVVWEPEKLISELRHRGEAFRGVRVQGAESLSLREQVQQAARKCEAEILLRSLEQHNWNRRRTAKSLKMSYRALLYRLKALELQAPPIRKSNELQ